MSGLLWRFMQDSRPSRRCCSLYSRANQCTVYLPCGTSRHSYRPRVFFAVALLCSISVGALHPEKQWARLARFTASTGHGSTKTYIEVTCVPCYDNNTGKRQPFTGNVRDRRNQKRCSKFFPHYVENWGLIFISSEFHCPVVS